VEVNSRATARTQHGLSNDDLRSTNPYRITAGRTWRFEVHSQHSRGDRITHGRTPGRVSPSTSAKTLLMASRRLTWRPAPSNTTDRGCLEPLEGRRHFTWKPCWRNIKRSSTEIGAAASRASCRCRWRSMNGTVTECTDTSRSLPTSCPPRTPTDPSLGRIGRSPSLRGRVSVGTWR
jgi:hypothetical protein